MHIIHDGEKVLVSMIDVVLVYDKHNPEALNAFWCPYCRNPQPLLQFEGVIKSITPGHSPLKMPLIRRCVKCKINYAFNAVV